MRGGGGNGCTGARHGGAIGMGSGAGNDEALGCMGVEHGGEVGMESGSGGGDCSEEEDGKC